MKRICVLGDSHAAALKKGWDRIAPERPDCVLTFFPAPAHLVGDLVVSGNALVANGGKLGSLFATASGGLDRIAADYDHYLVCGYGLTVATVRGAYLSALQPDRAPRARFLDETMAALRGTAMMEVMTRLRAVTARPVTMLAAPLAARETFWDNLERRGHALAFVETFFGACRRLAADFDAAFLPQPKRTLHPRGMTRPRYARNAAKLSGTDDDGHHMNAEYGAIVLAAALDAIAQSRASATQ